MHAYVHAYVHARSARYHACSIAGEFAGKWEEGEERHNKLIFIGRGLDRKMLTDGFLSCMDKHAYIMEEEKVKHAHI